MARPVAAWTVRAVMVLGPVIGGFATAWVVATLLPPVEGLWRVIAWWSAVLLASVVGAGVVEVLARRLAPLRSLLSASLLFPGSPPARWRIAARTPSRTQLIERIEEARERAEQGDVEAMSAMLAFISLLQAHDPETRGHAERVRMYTDLLTHELGLSEGDQDRLRWASLLHDIGKLEVAADVLQKDGPLDDEEWARIRQHPSRGMALCAPLLDWLGPHADAIGQHHERFDGGGYPAGLAGEEIGRSARIVSVVDAFEVMTGPRSYRTRMSVTDARAELLANAGSQFDPAVVRAFLGLSVRRIVAIAGPAAAAGSLMFLRPSPALANGTATAGLVALAAVGGVLTPPSGAEQVVEQPAAVDQVEEVAAVDEAAGAPVAGDPGTADPEPADPDPADPDPADPDAPAQDPVGQEAEATADAAPGVDDADRGEPDPADDEAPPIAPQPDQPAPAPTPSPSAPAPGPVTAVGGGPVTPVTPPADPPPPADGPDDADDGDDDGADDPAPDDPAGPPDVVDRPDVGAPPVVDAPFGRPDAPPPTPQPFSRPIAPPPPADPGGPGGPPGDPPGPGGADPDPDPDGGPGGADPDPDPDTPADPDPDTGGGTGEEDAA
ncbi:HD-GYP domain-containing protein [Euzebya sp.]|uniref:HD-GYP domain-containing protein n=1 Tax=Euzebya sp. TaxID=1971409 RepID=UPI0035147D1E